MEFLIAWKNTLGTSELPQARETLLRRIVAELPEELSTRSPKKFIEQSDKNLQRLTISNPANQLKRFRVGDKRNLNSEFM